MGRIDLEKLRVASEEAAKKQAAVDAAAIADMNKRIAEIETRAGKTATKKKSGVPLSSDGAGDEPVPAGVPGGRLTKILSGERAASVEAQISADLEASGKGTPLTIFPPGKGPKRNPDSVARKSDPVPNEPIAPDSSGDDDVPAAVDRIPASTVSEKDDWIAAKRKELMERDPDLDDRGASDMAEAAWGEEERRKAADSPTAADDVDAPLISVDGGMSVDVSGSHIPAAADPITGADPSSVVSEPLPVDVDGAVAKAYEESLHAARRYNAGVKEGVEKTPNILHGRRTGGKGASVERADAIDKERAERTRANELEARIGSLRTLVSEKASEIADIEQQKISQREKLDKRVASRMEYEKRFSGIFSKYFTKETMLAQLNREEDIVRKELYDMGMETRGLSAELDRLRAELKEAENDLEMLTLSPEEAFLREQIETVRKNLKADPENVAQRAELARLESLVESVSGVEPEARMSGDGSEGSLSVMPDPDGRDEESSARTEEENSPKSEIEAAALRLFEKVGIDRMSLMNEVDGFSELSYGQQLLAYRNYNQLLFSVIGEKSRAEVESDVAKSPLLRRIGKSMIKEFLVGKKEKELAGRYASVPIAGDTMSEEKLALLRGIVASVKAGPECSFDEEGNLLMQFASGEAFDDLSESSKRFVSEFNAEAANFSRIPHEWRYERTAEVLGRKRKRFLEASESYEEKRSVLLYLLEERFGKEKAVELVADIDGKVRMTQFLSSDPEVENALVSIDEKSLFWKAALNSLSERSVYLGLGLASRAVGGVVLGSMASGAITGWYRAKEDLKKKEKSNRKSAAEKRSLEAIRFSSATRLSTRLLELSDAVDAASRDEEKETREKNQALLESRIAFTRKKLDEGLVNFGGDALQNQFKLIQALARAEAVAALHADANARLIGRIERLVTASGKRIEKKASTMERNFKAARVLQGAAIAGTIAGVGALVREYGPLLFPSSAAVIPSDAADVASVTKPDVPTVPDAPEAALPETAPPVAEAEPTPGAGAALPEPLVAVAHEAASLPQTGEGDAWSEEARGGETPTLDGTAIQKPDSAVQVGSVPPRVDGSPVVDEATNADTSADSARRRAEILKEIEAADRQALAAESARMDAVSDTDRSTMDSTVPLQVGNPAQEGADGISKAVSKAWNESAEEAKLGTGSDRLSVGQEVRPDLSLDSQDPGTEFRSRVASMDAAGSGRTAPDQSPVESSRPESVVPVDRTAPDPVRASAVSEGGIPKPESSSEAPAPSLRRSVENIARSDIARGYLVRYPDKLPAFERLLGDTDEAVFGSARPEAGVRGIAGMAELGDKVEARHVMRDCLRLLRDPLTPNFELKTYGVPGTPNFEQMKNVGEFMMKVSDPNMFGKGGMPVANEPLRVYLERVTAMLVESGKTVKLNGDIGLLRQLAVSNGK